MTKKGKTREQVEAFLELVSSGFRRRGWLPGEPLTPEDADAKLGLFLSYDKGTDDHS